MLQGATATEQDELWNELRDEDPLTLAHWLIEGKLDPARRTQLTSFLSGMPYSLTPIPNLMFMRDPCAVVNHGLVVGHMKYPARQRESLLMRHIYSAHPKSWAPTVHHLPCGLTSFRSTACLMCSRRTRRQLSKGAIYWSFAPTSCWWGSPSAQARGRGHAGEGVARQGSPVRTIYAVIMPTPALAPCTSTRSSPCCRHDDLLVYPPAHNARRRRAGGHRAHHHQT